MEDTLKSLLASLVVVIGLTANASEKSLSLSEDSPDFEFSGQEKALESSYEFSDDIHTAELVVEPEEKSAASEPFKEFEDQEIGDNFSILSKRKPASSN